MTQDPSWLSAFELLAHYRARTLSPVEVVQALLARIGAVDGAVNAMAFVDTEGALRAARASEARWRRGRGIGPLDGVPVTLKDSFAAAGMPSCSGCQAVNPQRLPDLIDDPAAARVKEAGAVVLGKTTMPDFGLIASGLSSRFGITRNPWDLSRNPGGSSSGAAAALAAGLGPLAMGTDGGGSVRIPAAYCGVFALKPSYGRVPVEDPQPWVVAGPMARDVRDAALLMNVITRPDARDFTALPHDPCDYLEGLDDGVRGARIGLLEDIGFGVPLDPQVRERLGQAGQAFERLGAVVEPIPPLFADSPEPDFDRILHIDTYLRFAAMTPAQQGAMLPQLAQWCRRENAGDKLDLARSLVRVGPIRRATLAPFAQRRVRAGAGRGLAALCGRTAVAARGAGAHNPFCFPFNMSEQPAASIHGGFSRQGWPVGLADRRPPLRRPRGAEGGPGL